MDEYIGMIKIFAGNFAPRGWAFCNGQLLSIAQYSAVFSLLGTTYGGDGRTTFALPNLQGSVPIGVGNVGGNSYSQGEVGGNAAVTLTTQNIPAHTHPLMVNNATASASTPTTSNSIAAPVDVNGDSVSGFSTAVPNTQLLPTSIGSVGGNQPFDNRQPYLAVYYIICLEGIFPSRN